MRISRRHGLIFLANPKCASTTVERYVDVYMRGDSEGPKGYPKHTNARILDRYMSEHGLSYDDFLVFTTVRNPWDRLVSLWAYARKRPESLWFEAARSSPSLSAFLQTDIIQDHFVREFGLNGFTHTSEGRRVVDDVYRVEDYATALALMFRRLGIDFVGTGLRANPSSRDGYRAYYNDADRDLVSDLFKADIEYGGYRF